MRVADVSMIGQVGGGLNSAYLVSDEVRVVSNNTDDEQEWEAIYRPVNNSREQNVLALILHGHPFFFGDREMCKRNVRCGFRLHSRFSRSEASFFFVAFHQIHQEIGGCTANDGWI